MKLTKRSLALAFILGLFACTSISVTAQLTKEQIKERNEVLKSSKKALNEKATKAARKEAKKLGKDGWTAAPGALPIDKQLDRSYKMQMEYGSDLYPAYIMAEGMSIGTSYDAAKMQALELAKQNLASQIQTETAALIENSVANDQLGREEAASVAKSLSASKSLISQSLGRVVPVVEVYRTLQNKNKEVLVRIAYSEEMARQVALKAAKESLADETGDLHKKLDQVILAK